MDSPVLDPAQCLAHDRRLRALARELVRDASAADDLVQDAWLALLERRGDVRSLSSWLATVARRLATRERRSGARRAAREESVARVEAGPSTAEILAREEARRRVVEALVRLDEPLRTTLVLRFLEDLPPRAVAARLRVPVETVRTRTRRGLDALRAALDRGFGARERWLSALVPLARDPHSPVLLTLTAMSIQTKIVVSAAALVLLAWLLWPRATASPVAAAPVVRSPARSEPPAGELESAEPALAPLASATSAARAPVVAPEAPASVATPSGGSLRVHVTWSVEAHAPAANLSAAVVRVVSVERENRDLFAREATTDADGYTTFESLPVGRAQVQVDRFFTGPTAVEIPSGATAELEVTWHGGFSIAGSVADEEERPVAGAEIWFGKFPDLANGTRVARSAADGTFHLNAIQQGLFGARAPGYRPSALQFLLAANAAEVNLHLVLRAGAGELLGSVHGPAGEPVSGALVRAGPPGNLEWLGETSLDVDWGTLTRSDDAGAFRIAGLTSGPCPILVRAPGYALFRGEAMVPAGGSTAFTAMLAPEAALEGHVRDSSGAPASGVLVCVGDDGGPFRASALTRDDGSFRVGALEAERTLTAWVEGGRGSARTEIQTRAGRTETWEAVLDPLGEIRGRVLDERAKPLSSWTVRLEDPEPVQEPDQAYRLSAADGSFVFAHVHDRPHTLSLNAPHAGLVESLARTGVRPGPDELVLRVLDLQVPSARVVGTFLDEDGHAIPTAQLVPWMTSSTGAAVVSCDPITGAFHLGPFPPGMLKLILKAPGRGTLVREHELVADETWDVGEVRLAREGRLRVQLVSAELEPAEALSLTLEPGFFSDTFEGSGAERLSPPLAPGRYTLFLGGGEYAELALPFEIQSGVEASLDVPLRRGWRTPVAVRAPADVALGFLRVQVPGGTLEHPLWQRQGELFVEVLRLPAGSYAVEASAGDRHATGTLVVEPADHDEPVLELGLD